MGRTLTMLTDAEFLALPDRPGKQELIDGELIELPPSKNSHDELGRRIAALLGTQAPASRLWIESAYQLAPHRWLQPDVSVSWPDQKITDDYKQGSPMVAVEIASRGNTDEEMERKRVLYIEHGIGELWIIYPKTRTMLVCSRESVRHIGAGEDYRSDLAGVTVSPEFRTVITR